MEDDRYSSLGKFRNKALDTQSHELSLIRSYESHLLAREEENTAKDLALATSLTHSLVRLSGVLRGLVRLESGEEHLPQIMGGLTVGKSSTSSNEGSSPTGADAKVDADSDAEVLEDREPWMGLEASESDYALERDIELARLEKENEELRRLAGLLPPLPPQHHATQSQNPFQNHATGHGHHGLGERTMSGGLGGLVERRTTGPEYRSIFDPVQIQSQQQQQQHLAGGRLLLSQMGLGQMHGQTGR